MNSDSHFFDLNFSDLKNLLHEKNLNQSGASTLFRWHYKFKNLNPCELELANSTRDFIYTNFSFKLPSILTVQEASDKTVKFLLELSDQSTIEAVLIPFQNKYSLCVSSQVGCAMKCSFCYTGTQGLKRHLSTSEIIGQYLLANVWLNANRLLEVQDGLTIKSIVFMGQGEPLHNFDNVKKACEILLDDHGASLGLQRITISTAGYLPGLKRWLQEIPGVNLALSLHSPFEEKRNELIPINERYPLEELFKYIDEIPLLKKQFITYEYLLIDEFNNHEDDAIALAKLLKDRKAIINLIPFNPYPGSIYRKPNFESVMYFKGILENYKIPTMVRTTKGDDILAACGQLKTTHGSSNFF